MGFGLVEVFISYIHDLSRQQQKYRRLSALLASANFSLDNAGARELDTFFTCGPPFH
jgi:hypothetical protein